MSFRRRFQLFFCRSNDIPIRPGIRPFSRSSEKGLLFCLAKPAEDGQRMILKKGDKEMLVKARRSIALLLVFLMTVTSVQFLGISNAYADDSPVTLEDGVYKLPSLEASLGMFNHFVAGSGFLIVNGDNATVRFITDGSTASIQKYTKVALGKASELIKTSYQPDIAEGTPVFEGTMQPYDEGTGKKKYLFEIVLNKADVEAALNDSADDDIYAILWNSEGASTNNYVPGWYKPSKDMYLTLGALGEKTTAPADAEEFGFTLQVGKYEEGADFHTASLEDVEYALKDAAGNLYDPSHTTEGMLTYSHLSAANTYTFTATKEGWTVVKQGEWNIDAHAYEYIPMDTDEINVTITSADDGKNISEYTNPGMVFRKKARPKNAVDEALELVPKKTDIFTEASVQALETAVAAADPEEENEETLNAMAKAVTDAVQGLVPVDGSYFAEVDISHAGMFKIIDVVSLDVVDGKMSLHFINGSKTFIKLFIGTVEDANAADAAGNEDDMILPGEEATASNGKAGFNWVVPVSALETEIPVAAYSKSKSTFNSTGNFLVKASSVKPLNGEVELTPDNNTGMFKVKTAKLVTEGGKESLVFTLTGTSYHELYLGTYEEAIDNGDGSKENGNDTWIHGAVNGDGAWEFSIPSDDIEDGEKVIVTSVSNNYYEKYLNGQNSLARAFYPRQFVLDREAGTIVTGDYEDTFDIAIKNNVKMFSPAGAAKVHVVGGPNSNGYTVVLTLPMTSASMDKVRVTKYSNYGGNITAGDQETIDFAAYDTPVQDPTNPEKQMVGEFAEIPVLGDQLIVMEFHSKKNDEWYKRDFTLDLAAKEAVFDSHKATIEDLEGMDLDETVAYVKDNANVELMQALIEAIQVQNRDEENTDRYCAAAKACWDALDEDGKQEDDGYFSEDTGDASRDDPLNEAPDKDTELLVVSFGTSYNDSRVATIGAIEKALQKAYPTFAVRRAFTAQIIINHIASRDGEQIDNVKQAMDKAVAAGVKTLIVQPTHLMSGKEYDELKGEIDAYADNITIRYAKPLLDSDKDKETVAKAVVEAAVDNSPYKSLIAADKDKTAFVFMGHGTSHEANVTYTKMQEVFDDLGYENCFVGTVEGEPEATEVHNVLEAVKSREYDRVILRPLMVVAGDHAHNDMADPDDDESWYSIFSADDAISGVRCQLCGLGEIKAVQRLYVKHTKEVAEEYLPESNVPEQIKRLNELILEYATNEDVLAVYDKIFENYDKYRELADEIVKALKEGDTDLLKEYCSILDEYINAEDEFGKNLWDKPEVQEALDKVADAADVLKELLKEEGIENPEDLKRRIEEATKDLDSALAELDNLLEKEIVKEAIDKLTEEAKAWAKDNGFKDEDIDKFIEQAKAAREIIEEYKGLDRSEIMDKMVEDLEKVLNENAEAIQEFALTQLGKVYENIQNGEYDELFEKMGLTRDQVNDVINEAVAYGTGLIEGNTYSKLSEELTNYKDVLLIHDVNNPEDLKKFITNLEKRAETAEKKAADADKTKADLTKYTNIIKIMNAKPAMKSVKNKKGKKAVVKFKGLKNLPVSYYQVSYKVGKKTKTKTYKKATKSDVALKYTLKKLKKGKKYKVKVRAVYKFKLDGKNYKVTSKWSKAKKVKIKK